MTSNDETNDLLPTEVMARIERLGIAGTMQHYDDMVMEKAKQRPHAKKRYHVTERTKRLLRTKDSVERDKRLLRVLTDRWALVQVLSTPNKDMQFLCYIRDLLYVLACWEALLPLSTGVKQTTVNGSDERIKRERLSFVALQ